MKTASGAVVLISAAIVIEPCSVNFTAFESRFSSTWRSRRPSARTTTGTSPATSRSRDTPRSSARAPQKLTSRSRNGRWSGCIRTMACSMVMNSTPSISQEAQVGVAPSGSGPA